MSFKYTLDHSWFSNDKNKIIEEHLNIAKKYFSINIETISSKVLLSPHASFFYSGICMASVYGSLLNEKLEPLLTNIKTVIVLSTLHFNLEGLYTTDNDLTKNKEIYKVSEEILEKEHSFQINLPYIYKCFPSANIIPIFVGKYNEHDLNKYINILNKIDNDTTFWVINSDLNHSKFTDEYDNINREFCSIIAMNKPNVNDIINNYIIKYNHIFSICGIDAIRLFLSLNFAKNLYGKITCYYNSNIINISNNYVVGYCGMLFLPKIIIPNKLENILSDYEKTIIKDISKNIIKHKNSIPVLEFPSFFINKGIFVTLKIDNKLRGCIGTLETNNSIYENIIKYSYASAYMDNRFKDTPILEEEIDKLEIKINILDDKKIIIFDDFKINLYKKGIILYDNENNNNVSLFLASVPLEHNWTAEETLFHLINKANLKIEDVLTNLKHTYNYDIFHHTKYSLMDFDSYEF